MNYIKITTSDVANGQGVRVTLWTSGCTHHCSGCHNPETHSFAAGREFTDKTRQVLFEEIGKPYIAGLTLSGGDPMEHVEDLKILLKEFRDKFGTTKNVWLYTGYDLNQVLKMWPEIGSYVDVIIDGKFDISRRNTSLAFRGSENQKIWEWDGRMYCDVTISYDLSSNFFNKNEK